MTKRTPASGKTGFLFSMLLFFVFLFCSVFTVLIGSRVYENIRERDNDSFYRDTAGQLRGKQNPPGRPERRRNGWRNRRWNHLPAPHLPGKRGCLRNLDLHHGRRSQGTFYSQRQRPVRGGRTGNLRLSRPVLLLRRAGRKTPFNHLPGSFQRRFPGEYKKRLSSSSKRFRENFLSRDIQG